MVVSLFFILAGAGAAKKNTRSRSATLDVPGDVSAGLCQQLGDPVQSGHSQTQDVTLLVQYQPGLLQTLLENSYFCWILIRTGTGISCIQCCGSGYGSILDPYSGASWIRIRIRNTDPDPHMQIYVKMEAKDVRFEISTNNSETQMIKNFFR